MSSDLVFFNPKVRARHFDLRTDEPTRIVQGPAQLVLRVEGTGTVYLGGEDVNTSTDPATATGFPVTEADGIVRLSLASGAVLYAIAEQAGVKLQVMLLG